MPNFASAMKDEVVRLARKELRSETEGLKKASSQYRSDIAALKRRVEALEKQVSRFEKKSKRSQNPLEVEAGTTPVRFSAKGLGSQRQRLGLSAAEMGLLLDVSAQTIYNWEAGKSRPRQQQLAAIAALRGLGKRQVKVRLAELAG